MNKHDVESQGAKARDHQHVRHHGWRHAHRSWKVWVVAILLIAMIGVYVFSDNLSLRPGRPAVQATPALGGP